ncbi:MAG: PilW family protein [Pseudomonadales bacterium]|nr:PilW family protein [Pseudomonadales bacterium]
MAVVHRYTWQCKGLSLVELLVALSLGVVLSFGAMNLLLQSKTSYYESEALARLQENGRYALRYLSHELTMAGHFGSVLPGTPVGSTESGSACFDYLMTTASPLEHLSDVNSNGEADNGQSVLPQDCLVRGRHRPGTDLLLVRRTLNAPAVAAGERFATIDSDAIYLRTAPTHAIPALQRGGGGLQADSELWEYLPQVLFLRNYSLATDDGIPTLCRKRLGRSSNGMAPTECLVEGIENLQLEFGIDETGDEQADRFDPAPDPAEMAAAVAARIYLLVRSVHPVAGYRDERSYTLGRTQVEAPRDGYFRRVMQTTVLLRNRGISGR